MKIKFFILALALVTVQVSAFAQKGELNNAKTNYDKFAALKDAGSVALGIPNLKTAKASIDKASLNEKTQSDPAVWAYKALIEADLALLDTTSAAEATVALAQEAAKKAAELDPAGTQKASLSRLNDLLAQFELNKGVKAYQSSNFKDAYTAFDKSLNYRPGDTTLTYYAGLSAINAQDYPAAISKYKSLVETEYSQNKLIALDLSRLYAMQKDTANAIAVASKFAAKYNDAALATQEIELSLMSGKEKEIITRITEQAAKDPKNKTLQFYLGIAYGATKNNKKAEEAYKAALAIDPNYEDAALNLASGILNNAIDLYNTTNKLPASKQKEYEAGMKAAQAEFDRALPYLQRVVEINPKSISGWENLKTYYLVKKNQAKVDEIKKKIDSLK